MVQHLNLIYDYYGFPEESYTIQYPAPGQATLAKEVLELFVAAGIDAESDEERGFDHGMFVPLKLMYPEADIPCVQLSLVKELDPKVHIDIGKALSALHNKNILVLGSGMSFHNLAAFFTANVAGAEKTETFSDWLVDTITKTNDDKGVAEEQLIDWEQAPYARFCHPREEHLIPLHVCFGMAMAQGREGKLIFDDRLMQQRVLSFQW